jgi:hypothetical protein
MMAPGPFPAVAAKANHLAGRSGDISAALGAGSGVRRPEWGDGRVGAGTTEEISFDFF